MTAVEMDDEAPPSPDANPAQQRAEPSPVDWGQPPDGGQDEQGQQAMDDDAAVTGPETETKGAGMKRLRSPSPEESDHSHRSSGSSAGYNRHVARLRRNDTRSKDFHIRI